MVGSIAADLIFREARESDLPAIIALLAGDSMVQGRDNPSLPLDPAYTEAFRAIGQDRNNLLLVAEKDGHAVGFLQISFIPGLTHRGGWRAQIEGVRVSSALRGQGIGRALLAEAINMSRDRGCKLVQLMAHKERHDAHRFYENLGFVRGHEGFRLVF